MVSIDTSLRLCTTAMAVGSALTFPCCAIISAIRRWRIASSSASSPCKQGNTLWVQEGDQAGLDLNGQVTRQMSSYAHHIVRGPKLHTLNINISRINVILSTTKAAVEDMPVGKWNCRKEFRQGFGGRIKTAATQFAINSQYIVYLGLSGEGIRTIYSTDPSSSY